MTMSTMPTGPGFPGSGSTTPTGPTAPGTGTGDVISNFLDSLNSADFSIIAPVSEAEAEEAITLFSVANMLLAGKGERTVGGERKTDVLGVLTLFYGLQDRSLTSKLVVNSQELFQDIDDELKELRDLLDVLGADVDFLEREAKRQFNLGRNNEAAANTEFPRLFKRYVEIANDSLIFLDLRKQQQSEFADQEKVGRGFDLLRELKDVIVQLVRSLSKYGTIATTRINKEWAGFEGRAMAVLKKVAEKRLSDDFDQQRPLAVLADLTGKSYDTEIVPYVALAREGGQLLALAMQAYRATRDKLEDTSEVELLDLFQAQGSEFLTTKMRRRASIIRSSPLRGWM